MNVDASNLHAGPAISVGRIVHYVLPEGHRRAGEVRPAIAVQVWGPDMANLTVFLDFANDVPEAAVPLLWAPSAHQAKPGEKPQPGEWFWPPRVPA